MKMSKLLLPLLALACIAASPQPAPEPPGPPFQPPARPTAAGAPLVYKHSLAASPDETFFLVGENLTTNIVAWGVSASNPNGQEWRPQLQFLTNGYLAATIPERAQDGMFLVWLRNDAGYSPPILLNSPQPWWCGPDVAAPGQTVRVFGRCLSRRPDHSRGFVYLNQPGRTGTWADFVKCGKYSISFRTPRSLEAGDYEVWVHAGSGGQWGWGGPVKLHVTDVVKNPVKSSNGSTKTAVQLKAPLTGAAIQQAMDALTRRGGTVTLPAGQFNFNSTLRVPPNVILRGSGKEATTLQLVADPTASFPRLEGSGWDLAPGAVHTPGDTMEYQLDVPKAGDWVVWLRYATEMSPWKLPGVSGNMTLSADDGPPTPLLNLPNTGGFGAFKWSKSATLKLTPGRHKLTWRNVKGGGISLDAFVFALDPAFVPGTPPPTSSAEVIVVQGEDCTRFATKEGNLPGGDRAALWLGGDGAGVSDLTLLGNAQLNLGIAIRSLNLTTWLTNCVVERVRVADCDGKQAENCAIHARKVDHASIIDNELWGRAPLFIVGAKQTEFARNRLVSVTRYGGNAEAAILGRNETIEECLIEENVVVSPPGAEAGGPTARRLIWLSTGHGSITRNWLANNGAESTRTPSGSTGAGQARFGGVAGTDQNVGEMILFEGNHRTAYFGPLAGADAQSVTLPKTIPATPDNRLGNVKRDQLAHDAAGNETPFWPPDTDDGSPEPPINEYYVTVFGGRGQGQTRRVLKRAGERLLLDRPWTVPPAADAVVAVGTAFYQNLIVGNYTADGMTGVQLWISCVENVVSGNTIARQRKPGLFLYANGTTLASSMPRTWNRGISPLFWNVAEGNRAEECSAGALVTSGDDPKLPVEFPRALGNVLRHNSFIRSRTDGVVITSRQPASGVSDTSASIIGTIAEFNVVRDAGAAYHAAQSADAIVFRRNHAYFWYPVNNSTNAPVAFQIDNPESTVAIEKNSIEGIHGVHDGRIIDLKQGDEKKRLP